MDLFIPVIYFILTNGLIVLLSKKSFGKCIPITFMVIAFILYWSQFIFNTFKIGTIINIMLPILFIVLIFIKYRKKELKEFNKNFFTKSFYVFLIMYLCVYIFDLYRGFTKWDEFSHWGVMVKEMLRLDKFYSVKESTLMVHKDYPPIIQLFELFYTNLSGGYKEAYLIRAVHLFNLSLFIPAIFDMNMDKKSNKLLFILEILFMICSIFLIMLLFDGHNVINTIYIDYTMAIVTAYLLGIIVYERNLLCNFTLINLCIGLSFLLLIKQMGLPLYLMIIFMFIVSVVIKKEFKKENKIKLLKALVLLIIIPFFSMKGWNNYVDGLNIEKQFEMKDLKIMELTGIIRGNKGEKYQQEASTNYLAAIKKENITTSYLKINYIQCIIITVFIIYLLLVFHKDYFYKHQVSLIIGTLILGYIGYFLVMLVLYVFSFGPYEGPNLASFDRYMPTYVLICLFLIFMIFINIYSSQKGKKSMLSKLVLLTLILVLIQSPASIKKCFPRIVKSPENGFKHMAEVIDKNTENGAKIYIIAEDSVGDYQFYIKYYLDDKITNLNYFDLPVEGIDNYEDFFDTNVKEYMNEYNYLYLAKLNEGFKEKYSFLFDNNISEGNLYKIGNNTLELIEVK